MLSRAGQKSILFRTQLNMLISRVAAKSSVAALTFRRKFHEDGKQQLKKLEKRSSSVDMMLKSVVKVFSYSDQYNKSQPWLTPDINEGTGSGFAISGKKILTNAHVVKNSNENPLVSVKKRGSNIMYTAKVQNISHECDLAVLEIDDKDFWNGMYPLEFGDIPPLKEEVSVVGYRGGSKIWITKRRVSKVKTREYGQSATELLVIEIDGSVYHGNSGGPVIMGNKVIGVAFECIDSQNIGLVIPTPIIKRFLTGSEESSQNAVFGALGISYQYMKNAQIRSHYKMSSEMTGILINRIDSSSDAHRILNKNDIILAMDGIAIGNDETVPFQDTERISFKHLVSMKKPGETTLIRVLRKGKEHAYNISLKPLKPHSRVQEYYCDNLSSYYIFGGIVFVPLTKTYAYEGKIKEGWCCTYGSKDSDVVIMICEVLSDDINEGYEDFKELLVKRVNGVEVKNLKHLYVLIEECCTEDLRLDLEDDKVIILNYKSAKETNSQILKRHSIMSAISKDLVPLDARLRRRRKLVKTSPELNTN